MKRRRSRFARLGLLSIVLLLALCLTGVGYAAWSDEVYIESTVGMGYTGVVLSPGACSSNNISCSVITPHTLCIALTGAGAGTHTCGFTIENTGTIPVKIQSITALGVPVGVTVSVAGVSEGTQIEQAGVYPDSFDGAVNFTVPTSCMTFSFNVTFSFVQWNLYI